MFSDKVLKAARGYMFQDLFEPESYLKDRIAIEIGDLKITPFLCDHSAMDSYMVLVEEGKKKLLYTGDFRSNGRKSFNKLIEKLPTSIDILICEGTTYSGGHHTKPHRFR